MKLAANFQSAKRPIWNVADPNPKQKKIRKDASQAGPSNKGMGNIAQSYLGSQWMDMEDPYEQQRYNQHVNVDLKSLLKMQAQLAYSKAVTEEDVATAEVARATIELQRKK